MNFDFALLLVIATAISGVIWLLDSLFFASNRAKKLEDKSQSHDPVLVEYAKSFFPVLLVVLVLRSFIIEPFRIPSGSMIPTLKIGDFILVNKFSYGIRLPVIHKKIVEMGSPETGDVAVFRFPQNPSLDYIKRVIGIPGDRITYVNKTLYVNGTQIELEKVGSYTRFGAEEPAQNLLELSESLQGVEHNILISLDRNISNGEWVVPAGHYFVMGDNRDNSNDSRFWGFVPEENLVGKALLIWMNWNSGDLAWERIGTQIK